MNPIPEQTYLPKLKAIKKSLMQDLLIDRMRMKTEKETAR